MEVEPVFDQLTKYHKNLLYILMQSRKKLNQ